MRQLIVTTAIALTLVGACMNAASAASISGSSSVNSSTSNAGTSGNVGTGAKVNTGGINTGLGINANTNGISTGNSVTSPTMDVNDNSRTGTEVGATGVRSNTSSTINTRRGTTTTNGVVRDNATGATRVINRTSNGVMGSVTDTIDSPLRGNATTNSSVGVNNN